MKKVSFIFGTRPEAIKLCPLITKMRESSCLVPHVCVTGQHREMLLQVLDSFAIEPDVDLALMRPNQNLSQLAGRALSKVDKYLEDEQPELVVVQGDTTSVFAASMAAFHKQIPVAHVEAGLRTWRKYSPFPEEINRVLTSRIAEWHFAPTQTSRQNLLREGVPDDRIVVVGNPVVDALLLTVERVRREAPFIDGLQPDLQPGHTSGPEVVLVTGHRRENFGDGMEQICSALARLANAYPQVHFVYPVHLNPNVQEPVARLLGNNHAQKRAPNLHLIEPLDYVPFVALMDRAKLILTDSGGIQEEGPSLGKPVLVMRDSTERPEAIEAGTARLVGANADRIFEGVSQVLNDPNTHRSMAMATNPYGDGKACNRIVDACSTILCQEPPNH